MSLELSQLDGLCSRGSIGSSELTAVARARRGRRGTRNPPCPDHDGGVDDGQMTPRTTSNFENS